MMLSHRKKKSFCFHFQILFWYLLLILWWGGKLQLVADGVQWGVSEWQKSPTAWEKEWKNSKVWARLSVCLLVKCSYSLFIIREKHAWFEWCKLWINGCFFFKCQRYSEVSNNKTLIRSVAHFSPKFDSKTANVSFDAGQKRKQSTWVIYLRQESIRNSYLCKLQLFEAERTRSMFPSEWRK